MTEVAHVNLFIIFIKLSLNTKLTSILFISIGHIYLYNLIRLVWLMVFNATFNNVSVISWQSVLVVEETGGPGENHQHVGSH